MSPFSTFSINQPSFLQKTNIYLELGFEFELEFGPQTIRNLANSHRVFVVRGRCYVRQQLVTTMSGFF